MIYSRRSGTIRFLLFLLPVLMILGACNLGAPASQPEAETETPTAVAIVATRTPLPTRDTLATIAITPISIPTQSNFSPPSIVPPTVQALPSSTPIPISIAILAPVPGNRIAGNVQVLGSAIHPDFLQYHLEYGPDPNPGNSWFPITGAVQTPIQNGVLGIWNTNTSSSPDRNYQIRLRVILRDGRQETTVVSSVQVQNEDPTPIPSDTPDIPPPIAAFTQDFTSGDAPLVVRFNNLSQGNIDSYSWDFGDDSISNVANPIHTFTTPGVYVVALTVTGTGGITNVSREINVLSPQAPEASFSPDVISGESPLTVNFSNVSTGNIDTYRWRFGDNETSSQRNPVHTFKDEGTYNVILEVIGPGGRSTAIRQITVENPQIPPPVANFTSSTAVGEAPLTVQFQNNSEGSIDTYLWDFEGDGLTDSSERNPSYTYEEPGEYPVTLTVIGKGGQASADLTIGVTRPPEAPRANFSPSISVGNAPLQVEFSDLSQGDIEEYEWDFNGDGVIDSREQSPAFDFVDPGTYVVTLRTTGRGGVNTMQQIITVTTPLLAPTAGFVVSQSAGEAPLAVRFTNQSDGDQLAFEWDFDGDGTTDSSARNPSFAYDEPGVYTPTLTVTNPVSTDSFSTVIEVSQPAIPPIAGFAPNVLSGTAPVLVSFVNISSGDIDTYAWDFDGDQQVDSTAASPSFSYQTPGTYLITLTVTGPGGIDVAEQEIRVDRRLVAPNPSFTTSTTQGTAPLSVLFTDTSTGDIESISWDFESDGRADAGGRNTVFTFTEPGTFVTQLTVNGEDGSVRFAQEVITVSAPLVPPSAAFASNTLRGEAPLNVIFIDRSSGDIERLEWDFDGDGEADNEGASAQFTFEQPGVYDVQLSAVGMDGTTDTSSVRITVLAPPEPPQATFNANITEGVAPLTVTFRDISTGDIDRIEWDFDGDEQADSSGSVVQFTFDQAGDYDVSLTAYGEDNTVDVATIVIRVAEPLEPPEANFVVDVSEGVAPLVVNFSNTSTGDIDRIEWDFDEDGQVDAFSSDASFTYQEPGTYTAQLTVIGEDGSTSIFDTLILVERPLEPAVASFVVDVSDGTAPLTVRFTNTSTGDIAGFEWDLDGNGNIDQTRRNPTFVYQEAGEYTATLFVTGEDGNIDRAETTISVARPLVPPVANFFVDVSEGTAPLTVNFTSTSDGDIDILEWDFNGDGIPDASAANAQFVFEQPGDYDATLTVLGLDGTSDTTQTRITVERPLIPPTANFDVSTTGGTAPLEVSFTSTSTGDIANQTWDFDGDGQIDSDQAVSLFTYQLPGIYTVTLTVTGEDGSIDVAQAQITVERPLVPPQASFDVSTTVGIAPLTVTFSDTSTGDIASASWDFDNDNQVDATNADPSFTYQQPGEYTAILTVIGQDGNVSVVDVQIVVERPLEPAIASFVVDVANGIAPLTVNFSNTSTGDIAGFEWDFDGDGIIDQTRRNPSFIYRNPGEYSAVLFVTGEDGNVDRAETTISVARPLVPPGANFFADTTEGIAPLTVNFANTSSGDIDRIEWDFNGDGVSDSNQSNPQFTFDQPGDYDVSLTVVGLDGTIDVITTRIRVARPLIPPQASFTADVTEGVAPLTVTFANTSTGDIATTSWDFNGDGGVDDTNFDASFTYQTPGDYVATLTLTGEDGSIDTATMNIRVNRPLVPAVSNFTVDVTEGTAPLTVNFTDISTGDIASRSWDFNGDGQVDATNRNPSFTYQQPGIYTVTQTVIGEDGNISSATAVITVERPLVPPEASFTVDITEGTAPLTVNFTNTSSGDIADFAWDFDNDGSIDHTRRNPSFIYQAPGQYSATLTTTGLDGTISTTSTVITVTRALIPPQASFVAQPLQGTAPLTVNFTDTSTGDIASRGWDFNNDGQIDDTSVNPSFTYQQAGDYVAILTVTGEDGNISFAEARISVARPLVPAEASFVTQPQQGTAPLSVNFTDTSTGDIVGYAWDFNGDGQVDATNRNPSFIYQQPGEYLARLTVTGEDGNISVAETNISVARAFIPAVASFIAQPQQGTAPLTVNFTDTSTGDVASYSWDLDGNGSVDSTDQNPSFTYQQAGDYPVTLTVVGEDGNFSVSQAQIRVSRPLVPPQASFIAQPQQGVSPLTVTFTNTSTGDITGITWDFDGNGSIDDTNPNTIFTYQQPGQYVVTLTATGEDGTVNTSSTTIVVNRPLVPPEASFTAQPQDGTAPLTVNFSNTSIGDVASIAWDFNNDGQIDDTNPNPVFTYQQPGEYTVVLTTTGQDGTSSVASTQIRVSSPFVPVQASFVAEPLDGTAPLFVNFTNTATGDIASYAWDFNNDGQVDDVNPNTSFVYQTPGEYQVVLTVTGQDGSVSTAESVIFVAIPFAAPTASFFAEPVEGNAPLSVTFTNTSAGDITNIQWDFNNDGQIDAQGDITNFTFTEPGFYAATLYITGQDGSTSQTSQEIIVIAPPTPETGGGSPPIGDGLIAYVTNQDGNNEIYIAGIDGSNPRNLTNHPANDRQPAWTPDGRALAFVSDRDGNDEIYILELETLRISRFTNHPSSDKDPAWSPDRTRLAFTSDRFGDNDIFYSEIDGERDIQVTFDVSNDNSPSWSPDGTTLAFVSDVFNNNDIFTVDIRELIQTQLTFTNNNERMPAWSPEDDLILYISDEDGNNNIYVMNTEGGNQTRLTDNPNNDRFPSWANEGRQILFTSNRRDSHDIFIMNANGRQVSPVIVTPGNQQTPVAQP